MKTIQITGEQFDILFAAIEDQITDLRGAIQFEENTEERIELEDDVRKLDDLLEALRRNAS